MRAVSEAVVMLTPKVKATLFIPTPTNPTPAMRSWSPLDGPSRPRRSARPRTTSPARTNLIATKGSGGTSKTASLTATGLVPRKRTARSREASVSIAALPLPSVTVSDSTPGLTRTHTVRSQVLKKPAVTGEIKAGLAGFEPATHGPGNRLRSSAISRNSYFYAVSVPYLPQHTTTIDCHKLSDKLSAYSLIRSSSSDSESSVLLSTFT